MEDSARCCAATKLPVRVGRYLLKKKLEDGIFKAVDAHSGQEVVCKVLDYTQYRQALCAYCQLPAHPNINKVLDVILGEACSFVFFSRSFGNLHALLRTGRRLHEDRARTLFRQLVSAVAHCHNHGLVLKDIKLNKFVFKDKERTVLMLERVEDAVLMPGVDCPLSTTPSPYTSPEMLQAMEQAAGGRSEADRGGSGADGGVSGADRGGSGAAIGGSGADRGGSGAAIGGSGADRGGSGGAIGGSGAAMGGSGADRGGSGAAGGGSGADKGGFGAVLTHPRSSDIWALGVMLHAMLLGRYPERTGLTGGGVVSPHAWCMIRSALHSNPAFRLSASELLTHPWLTCQPLLPAHTSSHTHDQTVPT